MATPPAAPVSQVNRIPVCPFMRPSPSDRTQGSCTAFIRPEYLLPPDLYRVYVQMRETALSPSTPADQKDAEFAQERTQPVHLSNEVFETVSKKSWIDVLMQILKVVSLALVDVTLTFLICRRVSCWVASRLDRTSNWAFPIETNRCRTSTPIPFRAISTA